jgi:hypothetical protein
VKGVSGMSKATGVDLQVFVHPDNFCNVLILVATVPKSPTFRSVLFAFNLSSGNDVYTCHAAVANLNAWAHLICHYIEMKITSGITLDIVNG